ncbi:MAG: hypothetical protein KDA81_16240, partial [Planctomycetaceae bacterium]|nr:hypothetical protein [Planctomycetaceae bacterium]
MTTMKFHPLIPVFILLCTAVASGQQQQLIPKASPANPTELQAVRVQEQMKPAFLIQPLVHRLAARRGQLLRFEFEIESNARPTRLVIRPVAMSQQEHGVIMPDPEAAEPNVIQVLSASEVSLAKGEKHVIQCQMRIPPGNSPFLSYGVLVTELPRQDLGEAKDPNQPRVGIRFMTQYLLRADVEVLGVRGDSVSQLELQAGTLTERDGNAIINVFIRNPTDTPMEFQMRTELIARETGRRIRSPLWVPVRSNQLPPDRYNTRILAETRLRMEGTLSEPVFSGDYDLKVEVVHQNAVVKEETFPVTIHSGDFPAQDATVVRVARDISIEPPHVELSLRKGGNRLQALTIRNGSQQNVVANIKP